MTTAATPRSEMAAKPRSEVAAQLAPDDMAHLRRLMGSWGMLADMSFADLLLFVPVGAGGGRAFAVLGQMRPSTSQTLHQEDLVGRIYPEEERPLLAKAFDLGAIVEGERAGVSPTVRLQCVPVRHRGEVVAVLARESAVAVGRRRGELERVYLGLFDRLAAMIVEGVFPFASAEAASEEYPRVSDGTMVLDERRRVSYVSPNAVNALHRMGVHTNAHGLRLGEMGLDETAVRRSFSTRLPVIEEIERRPDVVALLRCIPLLRQGRPTGALVLLRDVTDLRRRDRLLLSKDATIREIHHRVKNNLQTISSLLRLQARRLDSDEGRVALGQAEIRVRSIAVVHEILSRGTGDQVPFGDIVRALVRMAEDGVVAPYPVRFGVTGDVGELPADVATPLAVVLSELLQNAVAHGFPADGTPPCSGEGLVELALVHEDDLLAVKVRDNGTGLTPEVELETTRSLGLSIVRDLVKTQLRGSFDLVADGGTLAEVRIPLPSPAPPALAGEGVSEPGG